MLHKKNDFKNFNPDKMPSLDALLNDMSKMKNEILKETGQQIVRPNDNARSFEINGVTWGTKFNESEIEVYDSLSKDEKVDYMFEWFKENEPSMYECKINQIKELLDSSVGIQKQ